mmetsp:Transcript_112801/g.251861  ORF Transcript_112801/g.251861 Transcript_112801/m.251861 type:complete len:108 (-) Transcript_112801:139-462(-)
MFDVQLSNTAWLGQYFGQCFCARITDGITSQTQPVGAYGFERLGKLCKSNTGHAGSGKVKTMELVCGGLQCRSNGNGAFVTKVIPTEHEILQHGAVRENLQSSAKLC